MFPGESKADVHKPDVHINIQYGIQLTGTYLTDISSKFQKLPLLILKSWVLINRHFPKIDKNRGVC